MLRLAREYLVSGSRPDREPVELRAACEVLTLFP
jgi:hypothetical protein